MYSEGVQPDPLFHAIHRGHRGHRNCQTPRPQFRADGYSQRVTVPIRPVLRPGRKCTSFDYRTVSSCGELNAEDARLAGRNSIQNSSNFSVSSVDHPYLRPTATRRPLPKTESRWTRACFKNRRGPAAVKVRRIEGHSVGSSNAAGNRPPRQPESPHHAVAKRRRTFAAA